MPWADLLNHGLEAPARYCLEGDGDHCDFVMTLTSPVQEGCELLQSYGEKSNATLLLDYGFVLPRTKKGAVSLSLPSSKARVTKEVSGHDFAKLLPLLRAAASEDSSPRSVEVTALGHFESSIQQALSKLPKLDEGAGSQPDSGSEWFRCVERCSRFISRFTQAVGYHLSKRLCPNTA